VVIKVNAQKFFRIEVNTSWGHLIKERKTLTKPEETVKEAKGLIVTESKKHGKFTPKTT
jgi:hypothetical protein